MYLTVILQLEDLDEVLNVLIQLPYLTNLSLNGNPFCKIPFYREVIISRLKQLTVLDGKNVQEAEVEGSSLLFKKIEGIMEILLSNFIELIKLDNVLHYYNS